jgi:hypothetical protein
MGDVGLRDRDEVDQALVRMRRQEDAISDALLELDDHPGRRFLEGASLTGVTAERWARAGALISGIWERFTAYKNVLDAAKDLRDRHSRPSTEELAELTRLLTGRSIEILGEEVPLERRGLLQPSRAREQLTPAEVIKRMNAAYEEAVAIVVEAGDAWSALTDRLAQAQGAYQKVVEIAVPLGGDPWLDDVGHRLAEVRDTIATDPLSLWRGDRAETATLDQIELEVLRARNELEQAAALQADFAGRIGTVDALIDRVDEAEAEAAAERERVIVKINPALAPPIPVRAAELRARLAPFRQDPAAGPHATGSLYPRPDDPDAPVAPGRHRDRLVKVAAELRTLEQAAETALTAAGTAQTEVRELLEWRNELRGRLEAYRAKSARMGHSEDADLSDLHRQAHDLLWQAPCDLSRATAAVTRFQRAVAGAGKARPSPTGTSPPDQAGTSRPEQASN